ncbi:hypothetical protein GIB67_040028 [Kingdonia uniflora]|uniref:CCHC-type domain-containing protein n=1 Tax=Kingdonia uniflora TaxID=39325 RepID=A0A7J7MUK6_9MAGN|nr:hypothetical protein GIB67_040028 [Kingdonia uniflora]
MGLSSLDDYTDQFDLFGVHARLHETKQQRVSRYKSGLTKKLQEATALQPAFCLAEIVQLAKHASLLHVQYRPPVTPPTTTAPTNPTVTVPRTFVLGNCYGCGKLGHQKRGCPAFAKEVGLVVDGMRDNVIATVQRVLQDEHKEETVMHTTVLRDFGMGSTWTARCVMDSVRESKLFDEFIWVEVGTKHFNRSKILMQILDQLTLVSTTEKNNKNETESEELLKTKIFEFLEDKKYLLILDDINLFFLNDLEVLGVPFPRKQKKTSKVIITGSEYHIDNRGANRVLSLNKGLPLDDAWYLFCEKAKMYFSSPDLCFLAEKLVKDCTRGPLEVILLAGALGNIKGGNFNPTMIAEQLAKIIKLRNTYNYRKVAYEMLPSKALKDCFLYCTHYIEHDYINVKGLITSWIIEGFIDGVSCLEKASDEGCSILKELVDRYLLSTSKENHLMMHGSLRDRQHYIFDKGTDVILAYPELFSEAVKIRLVDWDPKSGYSESPDLPMPSTLLLYGNGGCLPGAFPDSLFQEMQDLKVIAILNAGIKSLPSSFSQVKELRILVLRGCGSLEKLNHIEGLQKLEVLCISGTSTLTELPDNLFKHMPNLKTLVLSLTEIESLPSSLSSLCKLEFLILRGCSKLNMLPRLEELSSLIVLDISDCKALKEIQKWILWTEV